MVVSYSSSLSCPFFPQVSRTLKGVKGEQGREERTGQVRGFGGEVGRLRGATEESVGITGNEQGKEEIEEDGGGGGACLFFRQRSLSFSPARSLALSLLVAASFPLLLLLL
jgi:hypothetical protein